MFMEEFTNTYESNKFNQWRIYINWAIGVTEKQIMNDICKSKGC